MIKNLIESLTKLLKARSYSLFVLVKSFISFTEGVTEGHTKHIKRIVKMLIHLRHFFRRQLLQNV